MVDIRHILCPIDLSLTSRRALDHAVMLAGWYGARLTALHVCNPLYLPEPPILFAEAPHPNRAAEPSARDGLEAQLHEWLARARAAGIDTKVEIDQSHNPAARILQCAGALPADLIVLGTHGRSGFERFMLGSITERVLRKAACPVLTVPPPAIRTTKLPFKRLLCPVDFSETSISALQFAFSIAKESDAHLTILYVIEWPRNDEMVVDSALDIPEYRERLEQDLTLRLQALISEDERTWCEPTTRVMYGKPYQRIVEVAENDEEDLIVMGVHGRNAVDVMLFGSTTNQTVRRAPCPVLTLRR